VRSYRAELMNESAATRGACADHLARPPQTIRVPAPCPLLNNLCGDNFVTASGTIRSPDALERRELDHHALDNSQSSIRPRVAPWPDHDGIRADSIGGRGGGLHRLPDHGRRYHESTRDRRHQPLTGASRKPARSGLLLTNHLLATRGSFYELDDQDRHQGEKPARSDHDRIRINSGHHRRHRYLTVSNFRDHPFGSPRLHRQRSVSFRQLTKINACGNSACAAARQGVPSARWAREGSPRRLHGGAIESG
jgi:hypothetical protein